MTTAGVSEGQLSAPVAQPLPTGGDVDARDGRGLTPVMLAVLSGQLETAVQLALGGANLGCRDPEGRTALELAVLASNREASLALLLIATGKFTRPLSPLLPPTTLLRLQVWVLDKAGKNVKAAAVVMRQHVTWLTDADGGAMPSDADSLQSLRGLVGILVWAARFGHVALCESTASYFAKEAPQGLHLNKLAQVQDAEGNTILHALVLSGQAQACSGFLAALPRADAITMLHCRNVANVAPAQLHGGEGLGDVNAVTLAVQEVSRLAQQLSVPEDATAPGNLGRGGAVRRRKGSDGNAASAAEKRCPPAPVATSSTAMEVVDAARDSDDSKTAAAAGDLLHLATAATSATASGRSGRAAQPAQRPRDAKPYQRRGGRGSGGRGGTSGTSDDCWLPGGFWWHDNRTPMPSGRQPGELAGWQPLAGELNQQRLQEQRQALSYKEQVVMGLGSRDDAAAYLQQLGDPGFEHASGDGRMGMTNRPITTSVDDSVIEHSSTFKQLASWGGFRRHFKGEVADGREDEHSSMSSQQNAATQPAANDAVPSLSAASPAELEDALKQRLHDQLVAKRAEILAAQQRLESLSLEQQELELLYTRVNT